MHFHEDPEVEGLRRLSASADLPRPHLAIFGGLHGNEPCGVQALRRLQEDALAGRMPELRGTLVLVDGNPEALRQGRRFTDGGTDLNRLFDYAFARDLARDRYRSEHHRAAALRPLLDDIDGLLDLHSSTESSPPFAIATEIEPSASIAAQLGLEHVVRGWRGPGMLGHRVLLAPMDARDRPGVAVECGRHDDPRAADVAHGVALRFLAALGGLPAVEPAPPPRWLRIHDAIRKPSNRFRFEQPIRGFDRLSAGQRIGHDGLIRVDVAGECTALLPNDQVEAGDDMLFLATDDAEPHP